LATLLRDPELKAALTHWFAGQSKYKNLREAAVGIGVPFNTLRGYFSGKHPSDKNLSLLVESTGVILHPEHRPAKLGKEKQKEKEKEKQKPNLNNIKYASRLLEEIQYDLARCIASVPTVQATLNDNVPVVKSMRSARTGRQIQSLMDALQRTLEPIINDPRALELVRRTVSGSDAGYLSGLLGSLFDDRRLQTWREMTTYKYGTK
jgi:hypothetical protein